MRPSNSIRGLGAALAMAAGLAAQAQPLTAPVLAYRSVFEGYQPFADEKTADWKAANQTVGEIGGWRAYAKEAAQPDAQGPSPQHPGPGQAPTGPQQPQPGAAGAAHPHAGHGKQ